MTEIRHTPKVTWTVIIFLIASTFSSGIAWKSILANELTDIKQWTRINAMEATVANAPNYTELNNSIIKLTTVVDGWEKNAFRDQEDKRKVDILINRVITDVGDLKIQVGRIDERLKK